MKLLRRLDLVLLSLVVAHVVLGAVRIPGVVYSRRLDDIEKFRERGAAAYFLDTEYYQGADSVRWILENVSEDAVVLWRGDYKGSFEFVPLLIAPRLLVGERWCPEEAGEYLDRPLATGTLPDGRSGVLVLVASGNDLILEVR